MNVSALKMRKSLTGTFILCVVCKAPLQIVTISYSLKSFFQSNCCFGGKFFLQETNDIDKRCNFMKDI